MDDISRELPPDSTGATPVSERKKGPEELVRFERGLVDEAVDGGPSYEHAPAAGNRLSRDGIPDDGIAEGEDSHGDGSEHGPVGNRLEGLGPIAPAHPEMSASDETSRDEPGSAEPRPDTEAAEQHADVEEQADAEEQAEAESDELADAEVVEGDGERAEAERSEDADTDGDGDVDGDGDEHTVEEAEADAVADETSEPVADDASDDVDTDEAMAAVEREAHEASVDGDDDDLGDAELGEDGLPIVPELDDAAAVARIVYVLMLTSREGMSLFRLAQACNTSQKLVEEALELLQEQLRGANLPVELTRVGDTVRWMSGAATFPYLQRLRGVKKLEKLSPAALETLAVIAYQQPVMRSEIESIRGVKAGPMLRTLLQHKLVRCTGRADVPGRPLQYGTTQHFLERFGLASLDDLPSVKEWKSLG